MSLKTLLQKIGEEITSIFSKTVHELETVILPAAIAAGNALKTVVDGDTSDAIGAIAGAVGKSIEDKVRTSLDNIIPKLQLAQAITTSGQTSAQILAAIAKTVGNFPAATKAAFYIEFTGMLATDLAGGPLTIGQGVQLAQYWYQNVNALATTITATVSTPAASAPAAPAVEAPATTIPSA